MSRRFAFALILALILYPERDLNPYACAHAPQTCLSTNFNTRADRLKSQN